MKNVKKSPLISVIIPAWNKAEDFASAVVKLTKNSKLRKQIISRSFNHVNKWTFDDYTNPSLSLINKFSSIRSSWGDDISHYY